MDAISPRAIAYQGLQGLIFTNAQILVLEFPPNEAVSRVEEKLWAGRPNNHCTSWALPVTSADGGLTCGYSPSPHTSPVRNTLL